VERAIGPALLCYDGSEGARTAIDRAGAVLGGGPAIVLCVWESAGSMLLRHPLPTGTELGRDLGGMADDVVGELDRGTAERAEAAAAEGAELARAAGFDARPLAIRAVAGLAERDEVTVWQAVLEQADEQDASVIVVGSRGRSAVRSTLLGSVSSRALHHSARPVLVVPGPDAAGA